MFCQFFLFPTKHYYCVKMGSKVKWFGRSAQDQRILGSSPGHTRSLQKFVVEWFGPESNDPRSEEMSKDAVDMS
jgi:hypothetical protein